MSGSSEESLKTSLATLKLNESSELMQLLTSLLNTFSKISSQLHEGLVVHQGSVNAFGDHQLSVDVMAEDLLRQWASSKPFIKAISSEEDTYIREMHSNGSFIVCWDPLDGGSIVDCNWAVGTIVAIWQIGVNDVIWKGEGTLVGNTGRQQVASAMAVYGPRTTALVAANNQVLHFNLLENFFQNPTSSYIDPAKCKIFAPANLRACNSLTAYKKLIDSWIEEGFTLRYTGGLVPDVYQLFIKSQGIFCNPASKMAPAKLRLVYELAAIANLVESAGGTTSDGRQSILDVEIVSLDQRLQFFAGSKVAVDRCVEAMGL